MDFKQPRGSVLGNSALSEQELGELLRSTPYCTLSFFNPNGYPGSTPINFAWDGDCFYIHCARRGERYEALLRNPRVCLSLFEPAADLHLAIPSHKSVVAYGEAECLEGDAAVAPLQAISLATGMPHKAELGYIHARLEQIAVFRIRPQHMTSRHVPFGGIKPV